MNIWNKKACIIMKKEHKNKRVRKQPLAWVLFYLRGCFRVQRNLFNYLWNLKTLILLANLREDQLLSTICESPKRKKKKNGAELWCSVSIYRGQKTKKYAWIIRIWIRTHPFVKKSKRVCLIITRRPLGQSPNHGNLALLECRSALQKCRIGPMASNTLSCSSAVWTHLLGFFGPSLYLDAFSSSV